MRRTSPRTGQEEQDYQRERNLLVDLLLDELKDLQLSQIRIINDIYHIRSDTDRTSDPGPTVAGTSPQDTKDDHLRIVGEFAKEIRAKRQHINHFRLTESSEQRPERSSK